MTEVVTASATLTNTTGLHARPSVKLTRLAKSFASDIAIALAADGPWLDAKSPVKMMRLKVPQGAILHVRAGGEDAQAAVAAIIALIAARFDEAEEPAHG